MKMNMKTIRKMSRNGSHEFSCAYCNTLSKLYEPHTFRELSIVNMRNEPYSVFGLVIEPWDWRSRNILLEFASKNKKSFKQNFIEISTYKKDNFRLTRPI